MKPAKPTRYEQVSRRALLKGALGACSIAVAPGLACSNDDESVFAGATARPVPSTTTTSTTTTTTPSTTTSPAGDSTSPAVGGSAVLGEMVISFTYTQGPEGKNESPYVAVWVEDSLGDLVQTVSLWYQQGRKGQRWLDHLARWHLGDTERIADGGVDNAATISSATRQPGSYDVVWDGSVDGTPAPAGDYFLCIESARENGPYSLIREPFFLDGLLEEAALPDSGELSAARVRIDV